MKKSFTFIVGIFFLLAIGFVACEKSQDMAVKETVNTYELPDVLKSGISKKNGLLIFDDKEHFELVVNTLVSENEKHLETYFEGKQDLSEHELEEQMAKDEFNPFVVFETFEKYHSFSTLRALLKERQDKWLDESENLSVATNPTIYALSARCLNIANINGEYMIGTTIYRAEADGLVYEVKNSDFTVLNSIRNGNFDIWAKSSNPNVIVHRNEVRSNLKSTMADCKAYVRHTADYNYADNRKMHCILDIDWDGWGSAAKAKAECYKRKKNIWGNWKWKRHWTDMGTSLCVNDRDDDCNEQKPYGLQCDSKYRNWAYYVSTHVYGAGAGLRVKSGEYGGVFKKDGYNDYSISW